MDVLDLAMASVVPDLIELALDELNVAGALRRLAAFVGDDDS